MPLEAELLASKAGGQLLRRLQFSHWRQHRDSWARQHESARSTRLAFAELLGDEPRSKPAAAAAATAKPAIKPAAAATLAPSAASEAPPARARAARQTRDSGAEAAVGEARLAPEEEEELDNLFDAPPVRSVARKSPSASRQTRCVHGSYFGVRCGRSAAKLEPRCAFKQKESRRACETEEDAAALEPRRAPTARGRRWPSPCAAA